MYFKSFHKFIMVIFSVLLAGCGSTANEVVKSPNCNQTLTFVQSPLNEVSPDGFTIFYDGDDSKVFESLLKQALDNQISTGCKNG